MNRVENDLLAALLGVPNDVAAVANAKSLNRTSPWDTRHERRPLNRE